MNIGNEGNAIVFWGTPTETLENGFISFFLNNCADIPLLLQRNDFNVLSAPPCDPIILDTYTIPDATFGVPWVYQIMILSGTTPINLTWTGLAGWITPALISGDTILRLSGTPDSVGTVPINITLFNCNNEVDIIMTINVTS